ncbi:hypothetical protein, partial [Streptomyces sp. CRB46]|uniref:hypothetical protein n=1 Tax=Streptomyces sp. CRB46 TaxID=2682613 RepID=UPI001F16C601
RAPSQSPPKTGVIADGRARRRPSGPALAARPEPPSARSPPRTAPTPVGPRARGDFAVDR